MGWLMFLVGGAAYSGTTLLSLLLNQGDLVCLDEPDFHKPEQAHRGIPLLRARFPHANFPDPPASAVPITETMGLMRDCELAMQPARLGVKTCDYQFVALAKAFREARLPVIAIVRDIRDTLVSPLPEWLTEAKLNERYRLVWHRIGLADHWIRYEDLVAAPGDVLATLSPFLGCDVVLRDAWSESDVHPSLLKSSRHQLLLSGGIRSNRVGIWRTSGKMFSDESHETARIMGYASGYAP
jgi:hypothetical protein